jgi:tetratricopeptide (TPR) repeat protein
MKIIYLLLALFIFTEFLAAQTLRGKVARGNKEFSNQMYQESLGHYQQAALDDPLNEVVLFDRADALYKLQKYDEAIEGFDKITGSKDLKLAGQAWYNLGNSHFAKQDYQKSIEAYKKTLDINPADTDAKYNLELARALLKEMSDKQQQQPQQNQNQNQQQGSGEDQQQEGKGQQQQSGEEQQEQKAQQGNENKDKKDSGQDEQQAENQQAEMKDPQQMDQEEAAKILNALKEDEQDAQKKKAPLRVQQREIGKDW